MTPYREEALRLARVSISDEELSQGINGKLARALLALAADLEAAERERDEARSAGVTDRQAFSAELALVRRDLAIAREALMQAVTLAEHLFQMIGRDVWQASGGDDGQGHYEGDYRADQIEQELAALRSLGQKA